MFNKFFPPKVVLFCKIMWNNTVKPRHATDYNITRSICIACWKTKATDTHTQHMKNWFSTATLITSTLLSVTFVSTLPDFLGYGYEVLRAVTISGYDAVL
jgi:hypothetical protein